MNRTKMTPELLRQLFVTQRSAENALDRINDKLMPHLEQTIRRVFNKLNLRNRRRRGKYIIAKTEHHLYNNNPPPYLCISIISLLLHEKGAEIHLFTLDHHDEAIKPLLTEATQLLYEKLGLTKEQLEIEVTVMPGYYRQTT